MGRVGHGSPTVVFISCVEQGHEKKHLHLECDSSNEG